MLREIDRPMPMPVGLVVKNGAEDPLESAPGGMPAPGVDDAISTVCVATAPRASTAMLRRCVRGVVDGVHAVGDQVEQHLLQMNAIAQDRRQIARNLQGQANVARRGVGTHQGDDVLEQLVHVQRHDLDLVAPQHRAHAVDDGARALVVGADVFDDRAQFVEVRAIRIAA